eukprot:COSAG06_NODE_496_length_15043_cov_8.883565_3_plen_96_part_00
MRRSSHVCATHHASLSATLLPVRLLLHVCSYVTFEGPYLHTEPPQPQTDVQQKTLNPAWKSTYRLQLGTARQPNAISRSGIGHSKSVTANRSRLR